MGLAPVEFPVLKVSAMICILIAVVVASAITIFWKCGVNPIIDLVSILQREKEDLKNEIKKKNKKIKLTGTIDLSRGKVTNNERLLGACSLSQMPNHFRGRLQPD
jgi:Tfp pilus assembly protein PilO